MVAVAAVAFAVGVMAVVWGVRGRGSASGWPGARLLVGMISTPLAVIAFAWAIDLNDTMGD